MPEGKSDAEVWVNSVLRHRSQLPAITVGVYDMALLGRRAHRLIEEGVVPLTKIPLNKRGKVDTANIDLQNFHLMDGSVEPRSVYTIDGHPGIRVHTDEEGAEDRWIPLQRGQVRRRHDTMYVDTTVPDTPLVAARLRGARVSFRLNSTAKQLGANLSIAAHLRPFPEQDPVFQDLFGLREDTESHHHKFKDHLWGKRARTCDPERNDLDLAIWQFRENNRARAAHRQRLGG